MSNQPNDKSHQAPHRPAAFINAIAEEGTKAEAVEWLQKEWNENCQLRDELAELRQHSIDAAFKHVDIAKRAEKAEALLSSALRSDDNDARDRARRLWHRQCGLDGRSCPTEKECEAFNLGFAASQLHVATSASTEVARLQKLINTPELEDFLQGVKVEQAHQVERWGEVHDRSKSAENWYWLVGYLAGKALRSALSGDRAKALHHTISSAAALFQWHKAIARDTSGNGLGNDQDLKPDEVKR